jgi:sec-independent protein translocase protein TatB
MFDIGFSEILLILGLALVVLGPDKLPQVARTIGRWAGRARTMARQFREQLEQEADEVKVNLDTTGKAAPGRPANASPPAPASASPPAATAAPGAASVPGAATIPAYPLHTEPPPTLDEFAARDAATTPAAMHAADPPPPAVAVPAATAATDQPT